MISLCLFQPLNVISHIIYNYFRVQQLYELHIWEMPVVERLQVGIMGTSLDIL